ncbi:hypothetical protein [Ramlibacter sp. PS4R-6]|uniref:hypothetical protein n=1 Tax=Ramlibacter sp. PS4R-6 TaxID=3133438 RepID=UPI0030A5BC9D
MFGLTPLGVVHTITGMTALVAGFWALARYKEITLQNTLGRVYLASTFVAAATALGIFQHGGFNPAHGLAIFTLLAMALGYVANLTGVLGRRSRYLQAICYSATFVFHLIPGVTETLTRLPVGAPVFPNAEAPGLKPVYAALLVAYAIGLFFQIRWLKAEVDKPMLGQVPA